MGGLWKKRRARVASSSKRSTRSFNEVSPRGQREVLATGRCRSGKGRPRRVPGGCGADVPIHERSGRPGLCMALVRGGSRGCNTGCEYGRRGRDGHTTARDTERETAAMCESAAASVLARRSRMGSRVRWRTDAAGFRAQYACRRETRERGVRISNRQAKEGERYFAKQEHCGESAESMHRGAIRMNAPRVSRLGRRRI
jgi:hypothetical protein